MRTKAEIVFEKTAGPISYVKGLAEATRDLPKNLKRISQTGQKARNTRFYYGEGFRNTIPHKVRRLTPNGFISSSMQAKVVANRRALRLKDYTWAAAEKARKGLILPAVGIGTAGGLGLYSLTGKKKDENK